MNIVCSIDNSYIEHCYTMLCSFFINNSNEQHNIDLLSEGLTAENEKIIKSLTNTYNGLFSYCQVNSVTLTNSPIKQTDYLTIAAYYRLFMTDLHKFIKGQNFNLLKILKKFGYYTLHMNTQTTRETVQASIQNSILSAHPTTFIKNAIQKFPSLRKHLQLH